MKNKTTPIIIAILIPLVSVAVALALVYFKKSSAGFAEFPYAQYLESPKNLAGNTYTLAAEMEMQLAKIPSRGRVVSVSDGCGAKLAVLVPDSLGADVRTKQRYDMSVEVLSDGAVVVKSMKKY